jgi:hypothetical protein
VTGSSRGPRPGVPVLARLSYHQKSVHSCEQGADGSQHIVERAVGDDGAFLTERGDLGIEVGENISAGGIQVFVEGLAFTADDRIQFRTIADEGTAV